MGQMVYILALLFIASISAEEQYQEKHAQKSRLILEYNWPEPRKNLNRLPHPHSCHDFIHIKHDGTRVVKRCHGDKVFDYRNLRCQNKHLAKCWMDVVKKGNMKKVKRRFSCPFPWGLYPDKEDCTLFYDCMGGKVYPRKCPHSTLFDVVERICVHSSKALCAKDSDINASDRTASQKKHLFETIKSKKDIPSEIIDSVSATIAFKPSRTFSIHSKENNSEDADVKNSIQSGKKYTISKSPFISTTTKNRKSFRTTDDDSDENSSEEINKKGRTKSKIKYVTSKSPFFPTSTMNRKSFRTTHADSEENSSEEINEKGRTKSKNKYTTSKSRFISTSTSNSKSFRQTKGDSVEDSSEEENSSEEKGNKISSKYELKSTISRVRPSSASTYRKENSIPISTNVFTENLHIISSSQGGHSTEVPFQASTIKQFVSTENNINSAKTTATHVVNKKDNTNDDMKETSFGTEMISEELTSSVKPSTHKRIDSTTKIPFTDSSSFRSEITESIEIGSKSVTTSSILCPDFDGHFPHPKNKHLYIACVGGMPTVMKCPENLVYDSNTVSCIYDKT